MILIIDNYDSFTFNLVHALRELGSETEVFHNDSITVAEVVARRPKAVVISPGPGRPEHSGISIALVERLAGELPILGVCLGHQAIAAAFGCPTVRAARLMHGKTSPVIHDGATIFAGLPNPFDAMRYHSLVVERAALPACLEVSAWTEEGEVMAVRHRQYSIEGVQFHPESFLTLEGKSLLGNFLRSYVYGDTVDYQSPDCR